LGVLAGVIGSLQATEAIKFILGVGDLLTDRLLIYNALRSEFRKISLRRNPRCRLCGQDPVLKELVDEAQPVCDLRKP
jgi:molybdopterin/thiamine biosynthesis adenylyltransferase